MQSVSGYVESRGMSRKAHKKNACQGKHIDCRRKTRKGFPTATGGGRSVHMENISRTLKSIASTVWHCLKNEPKESGQERRVLGENSLPVCLSVCELGCVCVCQLHSFDSTWLPIASVRWKISSRRHWRGKENNRKTNKVEAKIKKSEIFYKIMH